MGEIEERLKQALVALRPLVSWPRALDSAGLDIGEVWRQEEPGSWPMHGPPEEYALPPLVDWSDDLRRLAEAAYHERFGKCLAPGDRYVFEWPPQGSLWTEGAWGYLDLPECGEHGEERSPECAECQDLTDEIVQVVDTPAIWAWHVTVRQIFAEVAQEDDVHHWEVGITKVDPWEVEYSSYDDGTRGADLVAAVGWVVQDAAVQRRPAAGSSPDGRLREG